MSANESERVLGVVVCDFERTAIGTRSRLADRLENGTRVIEEVAGRLLKVKGIGEVAVLVPAGQMERAREMLGGRAAKVMELVPRAEAVSARVRIGRAWNLFAWRGGAGQWTYFDEEYHPAGIAAACAAAFDGRGAGHVMAVHSHAVMLDVALTEALLHHHLHKNRETRMTYTPAAPGLSGVVLRGDIVKEMGEKGVMPWQLLAYDPKMPAFDTLIREACMQVDPALSKIPNRMCVDTVRGWQTYKESTQRKWDSTSGLCLAAARSVAPGVQVLEDAYAWPREVEIELTGRRRTLPPGSMPEDMRLARGELDAEKWVKWLEREGELAPACDDLLVTVGGDGDPLCFGKASDLLMVLKALRRAGAMSVCVQTDLVAGAMDDLIEAITCGVVDVVSVMMYGHATETYRKVAGADLHGAMMKNMERLAEATRARGGVPLVVPRLLKVRETVPELEPFFDTWIERCGWAVIDGPTDRGGSVPFAGVVDMTPPKRKACRRLWDRFVIRADGTAAACDQDMHGKLRVGHIESQSIQDMWKQLNNVRQKHACGGWSGLSPCATCREWHRA